MMIFQKEKIIKNRVSSNQYILVNWLIVTRPETNSEFTPETGCLEDDSFPFGVRPIFRCELAVSFRAPPKLGA